MWYILNYIPGRGRRRDSLPALISGFNPALELFAPSFVSLREENGKIVKTEKPLLFHYIFVKGPEQEVKELCMKADGFSFVLDRSGASRHVTLSDDDLERFRIIAHFYAGKLPCYPLEGVNLEEGDRVQVVTGPCAGLTGTYMSRKGGKSGNILVAIDSGLAAIVYDVKADFVRVLEFARDSKRAYDQVDAFAAKMESTLQRPATTDKTGTPNPDINLISASSIFTRRLGVVNLHNPKLDAKLQILLFAAYSILSDSANAREALSKFRDLEQHVTNKKTRALCDNILASFGAPKA